MPDNQKLEYYLAQLETGLKDINPSERAKIIHETSTHILEARAKFPEKSMDQILMDLGTPREVSNGHRLNHGLKTVSNFGPSSVFKWIGVTFVSGLGLFLLFIAFLIWKFTPVFKVDEKTQSVTILGGLIDINGVSGKVKMGDSYEFLPNKFSNQFNGSVDAPKETYDELVINFNSGVLNLKTVSANVLSWDCQLEKSPTQDFISTNNDSLEMDLTDIGGSSCVVEVPNYLKITVNGEDAKVSLIEPEADTYIEISNGSISIAPNPELDYRYDLKVKNGTIGDFVNSKNKNAIEIKVELGNGAITKQ